MSKKSPMSLSLDYLNKKGWTCARVEHWNSFAKIRQDCFGFADILGYHPILGIALVQTTDHTSFSKRKNKITSGFHAKYWLKAGGRILIHGWGPNGLREEEL